MSLYTRGSKKDFAALTILRNKIKPDADDILTNHGKALNLDAILGRIDFAFANKRPCQIIEKEMSVLRQGPRTLIEFYNDVNKKLKIINNRTIMLTTYHNKRIKYETALRTPH